MGALFAPWITLFTEALRTRKLVKSMYIELHDFVQESSALILKAPKAYVSIYKIHRGLCEFKDIEPLVLIKPVIVGTLEKYYADILLGVSANERRVLKAIYTNIERTNTYINFIRQDDQAGNETPAEYAHVLSGICMLKYQMRRLVNERELFSLTGHESGHADAGIVDEILQNLTLSRNPAVFFLTGND